MTLGPTTQHPHWTISLLGKGHVLERDQTTWLETGPQFVEGQRLLLPCRRRALGRAARILPARLVHGLLKFTPITLAIAQEDDRRALRDQVTHELD